MKHLNPLLLAIAAAGLVSAFLMTTTDSFQQAPQSESAQLFAPWQVMADSDGNRPAPGSGFDQIDEHLVRPIQIEEKAPSPGQLIELATGPASRSSYTVVGRMEHANGDISVRARGNGMEERAILTYGAQGMFARVSGPDGLYLVHSDQSGSWLIDLNDERLEVDPLHGDTMGQAILHPLAAAASRRLSSADHTSATLARLASTHSGSGLTQIDVMFIYTPDMLSRYPNGLIETRLNHLIAIANQSMVDSEVPISVRLVHHRSVNYTRNQENRATLIELRQAMAGQSINGFEGVRQARDQHGADIVALTWPHDIEQRGSCGIAFFPVQRSDSSYDSSYGVHIDNDGASNWSICSDAVFTHELGHNLNAEHQRSQSSGDDPGRSNYAFIAPDRFHTVMGSFGTGHDNRYLRLDVFSNPRIQCGGQPCGTNSPGQGADNAAEISSFAPVIANYRTPVLPGQVSRPPPSSPDSDGDGVVDWEDPFPFDPFDGETPPPDGPEFSFSPRELRSGNTEDDWELLVASAGSNQILSFSPDGRFQATVTAPEAVNAGPILTEYTDMAIDDAGRLYLLASGDVRRYDRLSGELIDVFLDATRPVPAELQSPFPRALGFAPGHQLVVLGDQAIERYDDQGLPLNFPQSSGPTSNPTHWSDRLDLSLRAFATRGSVFFLTDADSGRLMRFDMPTGNRLNDVVGPNNPWVTDPWDLAIDDTGLVYLANGSAGNVLRFDPANNSFVDEFVPSTSEGPSFARAIAFGPDGDLYVACQDSSRIFRFDGQSGASLGVVAEAGTGGLEQPSSLLFARRVNEVHRGHSGHFFVPERAGEGWLFEVLDRERVTMSWFTYPPQTSAGAEQAWLVGEGLIDGNRVQFDEVLVTTGLGFGSAFQPSSLDLMHWGEISLEFTHCDHARLSYSGPEGWGEGSHSIIRLITIPGLPCGSEALPASADKPGISGQWFDTVLSGQGWFLQEIEPGRVFVSWYSYDDSGQQMWLVGDSGYFEGRDLIFDELLITRGTAFGDDFVGEDIELESWGRLRFSFSDCDRAVAEYESHLPGFGSGILQAVRLTGLEDLECQLP